MSNETEKNINEETEISPTVRAVMAALNGSNGSDIGRVTRMMSATQTVAAAPSVIKEQEEIVVAAEEDTPVFSDEIEINDSLEVDIFEENGEIVGIDNGVLFTDEELPGIETIEKYRGAEYVNELINEAPATRKTKARGVVGKSIQTSAATLAPVTIQSKKKVVSAGGKIVNAPAPKKPAGSSSTSNTKVKPKKKAPTAAEVRAGAKAAPVTGIPTAAEMAAQRKAREAADKAAMAKSADTAASDITKATEKVVADKTKQDLSTVKGGTVTKGSFLNRITGGRLGKGGTYVPPTDSGSLGKFDKDFTKKVTDTAAEIKKKREDDEASLGPVEIKSKKKPTTPAAPPPSAVEPPGGADEPDFTGAGGGGGGSGARMPDEDSGYDETPATGTTGGGKTQPSTGSAGGRKKIPIRFSIAGQGAVEREAYKKAKESGEIESQDVKFNVRNTKTGQMRAIKKGDPEYAAYLSRYKKMSQAVQEALLRMGAVLTEEGWMLSDELLESVYTEYSAVEMSSPYYYDSTGRLKIMSESEWAELGLAEVILEKAMKDLDDVGEEDEDVDNDGDSDKSDDYLANRRKAVAAAMAKGKK